MAVGGGSIFTSCGAVFVWLCRYRPQFKEVVLEAVKQAIERES
jgi:hypothetical protein